MTLWKNVRSKRSWIIALAVAALLLSAIGIWQLKTAASTPPAYEPYPEDALAVSSSEVTLPAGLPALKTENYSLSLLPHPQVAPDGTCEIFLTNPESGVWLMFDLRLDESGALLYRTGLLAPGKTIVSLPLSKATVELLRASGATATVTLRVYSFALESYESMGEITLSLPVYFSEEGIN